MAEGNLGPAPEAGAGGRVRAAVLGLVLLYGVMAVVALAVHLAVQGLTPTAFAPVFFAVYPAMGTLIVLRRGSHRIGWMLIAIGIVLLLQTTPDDYAIYAMALHPGSLPFGGAAVVLSQTIWIGGLFLFGVMLPLTFPTGHLMSRRWLIIVAFAVAYFILVTAGNAFIPNSIAGYPKITNPIGIKGQDDLFNNLQTLSLIPAVVWILGAVASIVVRYRRSRGVEREQMKWFLYSFLLVPVALALNNVPVLDRVSFLIAVPGVAVGIAVAVLRYRLYDIDVVISRTLVYGALAAFITAVYVGIVVGVGTLVGSGGKPNLVLSIIATAVVAVAFQPVRERLQKIANRLVYGKRATPYEVLSQFSERVAETYAADEALPRMARVLAEGTGAEHATVWLRRGAELHSSATWPEPASPKGSGPTREQALPVVGQKLPKIEDADRAVAVQHQGELLGALSVSKRAGESLTPIEDKLVDDLAHQAGLVLKNVGLTAELLQRLEELRASRQRLVAAQDEERRRLERNLHDGAQQNLVALKVKLGLAEVFAEKDPARARQLLGEIKSDADEALETLRDLARGIYPPLLADKGLAVALAAQARKATLPVEVDADGLGRYPQDIEAAVYFCVLEALQNVQKYAGALKATVRLVAQNGDLTFEVEDDGAGFDAASAKKGSGLTNMADRLDALGGAVEIESQPGRGTVLRGSIPALARVG
jgi:signal transduction histidine kinase